MLIRALFGAKQDHQAFDHLRNDDPTEWFLVARLLLTNRTEDHPGSNKGKRKHKPHKGMVCAMVARVSAKRNMHLVRSSIWRTRVYCRHLVCIGLSEPINSTASKTHPRHVNLRMHACVWRNEHTYGIIVECAHLVRINTISKG